MYYLSDYQVFTNKHELNAAIAEHVYRNNFELKETDRDIFLMISRYAVKYPGAAHLKLTTIADAISKTERTVRRSLAKLIALGMIERIEFMRPKTGGNGGNIFRICPPDASDRENDAEPVTPTVEDVPAENEPITLKAKNLSSTNITGEPVIHRENEAFRDDRPDPLDKRNLDTDRMPDGWYAEAAPYARNAEELYAITGTLYKAKKGLTVRIEDHAAEFGEVLRGVWQKVKTGKISAAKMHAYLFTAFRRTAERLENAESLALYRAKIEKFYSPDYVSPAPDYTPQPMQYAVNATMDGLIDVMHG